jgi:hypothetical protein
MKTWVKCALACGLLMALVNGAWAADDDHPTLSAFIDHAKTDSRLLEWIGQTGQAFMMANVISYDAGREEFYCQPWDRRISSEDYLDILAKYVGQNPDFASMRFEFYQKALLYGLEETFPCEKK